MADTGQVRQQKEQTKLNLEDVTPEKPKIKEKITKTENASVHLQSSPLALSPSASTAPAGKTNSTDDIVQLSDFVGSYGSYQFCLTALLFTRNVFLGLMGNSGPLMTPDVTFYCQLPLAEVMSIMPNISLMTPQERDMELKEEFKRVCQLDLNLYHNFSGSYTQTKMFPTLDNATDNTDLLSHHQHQRECTDFTYELAQDHGRTMTSEFDLVCDRDWLRSLFQSLLSAAIVVAHVFWGTFSDKYGRFQAQRLCWLISLAAGLSSVFATEFWTFVLMRALCSFGDLGLVVSLTTTVVELVGNQYRGISVALVNFGYALGVTSLPYIMAYFADFRYVIAFTVLCHIMTVPFLFTTNESVRWLCTNRRFKSARLELKRIARWNRRSRALFSGIVRFLTCITRVKKISKRRENSKQHSGANRKESISKDSKQQESPTQCRARDLTKDEFDKLFDKLVEQIESQDMVQTIQINDMMNDDRRNEHRSSSSSDFRSSASDGSDDCGTIIKEGFLSGASTLEPMSNVQTRQVGSTLSIELSSPVQRLPVHTGSNSQSNIATSDPMRATVIMDDKDGVHRYYTTGLVIGVNTPTDTMSLAQQPETPHRRFSRISLSMLERRPCLESDFIVSPQHFDNECRLPNSIHKLRIAHENGRSIDHLQPKSKVQPEIRAASCCHLTTLDVVQDAKWKTLTLTKRGALGDIYRDGNLTTMLPHNQHYDSENNSNFDHYLRQHRDHEYRLRDRADLCQQPDCINIVAHQLSFVGRVSRLFKDKKLMIAVFTIVWTTFNSELQYTSFIIINLEAGEDIYFNYVLGGCMEALATICASLLLSYAPRRSSLITFWLLISLSCFGLSVAHIDSTWAVWCLALAKFSQSCLSSIACVAAYETFPTFLRQSGSGLVFTLGMMGSVFAPLIFAEFDDHAGMDRVLMTFSFSSLTAAILIYLFLNETRNCELQ